MVDCISMTRIKLVVLTRMAHGSRVARALAVAAELVRRLRARAAVLARVRVASVQQIREQLLPITSILMILKLFMKI